MKVKSKLNLGQTLNNRLCFSDDEKLIIIKDYLSGNETKSDVFYRYTGRNSEHGKILAWMRKFGIEDKFGNRTNFEYMSRQKKVKQCDIVNFEILHLKKRIEELEKQLQTSEMKAIAFSTLVDIAEKEFNIPIRKKYNTNPLKK
jgi:transposase